MLSQKSKIGFLKTVLPKFVNFTSNESDTFKLRINCLVIIIIIIIFLTSITFRDGSSSHVTPGKWVFVAIVNDWYLWTIYTGKLHSECSRDPGSTTKIIIIIQFLYVYMYLCFSVHWPECRRSARCTQEVLKICLLTYILCPGRQKIIFKFILSFLLKVDLD